MGKVEIIEFYKAYLNMIDVDSHYQMTSQQQYFDYSKRQKSVSKMRNDLLHNGKKLNKDDDKDFLNDLLLSVYSGIAYSGRGTLEDKEYDIIVADTDVLYAIEEVIKTPNAMTGEKLRQSIKKVLSQAGFRYTNRYLIVNRALAACTNVVSSLVDRSKFSLVFDFLVSSEAIDEYPDRCIPYIHVYYEKISVGWHDNKKMEVVEWYNENCYLIKKLKELIKDIAGENLHEHHTTTEHEHDIYLSTFLWYIWQKKLAYKYPNL